MFDIFKWITDSIVRINKKNNENDKREECDHAYKDIGEIAASLKGGRYTRFVLLQCEKCTEKSGFPNDNLRIAIGEGTEETKRQLEELGLMVMEKERDKKGT